MVRHKERGSSPIVIADEDHFIDTGVSITVFLQDFKTGCKVGMTKWCVIEQAMQDGQADSLLQLLNRSRLEVLDGKFVWSKEIDNRLATEDGIWFSEVNQEVVLRINREVAGYFVSTRRSHL